MSKNEKGFRDVSIIVLLVSLVMLGTYTYKLKLSHDYYEDGFTKLIYGWSNCEHQKELMDERIRELEGY